MRFSLLTPLIKILVLNSCILSLVACSSGDGGGVYEGYFIDAHSQIDIDLTDRDSVITRMSENNVKQTLLAVRGGLPREDLLAFAAQNTDKIVPAISTKRGSFFDDIGYEESIVADSMDTAYGSLAEILSYHAEKESKGYPEIIVPLTDARVLATLQIAKDKGWPFIVHIEFASLTSDQRDAYWSDLNDLLDDNPDTPIALIHLGQLNATEAKTLLDAHDNVYFITSHADPVTVSKSTEPWTELFANGVIASDWKSLMQSHPTKFIFALDNVWSNHWGEKRYGKIMSHWRNALGGFSEEVANQIAHGNAERLWSLAVE